MLNPELAMCRLPSCAENVVKFEFKISNNTGRENQTKNRWEWSGKHNQNDTECGTCKQKLNPNVRPCGEVKNRSTN